MRYDDLGLFQSESGKTYSVIRKVKQVRFGPDLETGEITVTDGSRSYMTGCNEHLNIDSKDESQFTLLMSGKKITRIN